MNDNNGVGSELDHPVSARIDGSIKNRIALSLVSCLLFLVLGSVHKWKGNERLTP